MVANGAYTRTNGFGPDGATIYPRFFEETEPDLVASEREGRPIFRTEERVEIIMAGNSTTRPVQRVTNEHRQRWAKEYADFKAGLEMSIEGTPLEEWPRLRRAQVMELKAINFLTVEQIAEASDLALQRIPMYGRQLRDLAKAFLDDAHANSLLEKTTADNARKDAQIAALTAQVEELGRLAQSTHDELRRMQNAPHPLATHIPGMSDPVEMMKSPQVQTGGESAFASLGPPRRGPGKPPKDRTAEAGA
jgi:hypothetical protein